MDGHGGIRLGRSWVYVSTKRLRTSRGLLWSHTDHRTYCGACFFKKSSCMRFGAEGFRADWGMSSGGGSDLHSASAPWRQQQGLSALPLPSEHCQRQRGLSGAVWRCGVRSSLQKQVHHAREAAQRCGVEHLQSMGGQWRAIGAFWMLQCCVLRARGWVFESWGNQVSSLRSALTCPSAVGQGRFRFRFRQTTPSPCRASRTH